MATLTNTKIKDTYDGLLKTTDNEALDVSGVTLIEDGLGNASALSVGRSGNGVSVSGNLAVDTNTLYVDAANNRVGIGTASPETDLEIENTNPTIIVDDNRVGGGLLRFSAGSSANTYIQAGTELTSGSSANIIFGSIYGANEYMRIDSSGNVGIGKSPDTKLHLYAGDATFEASTASNANIVLKSNNANSKTAGVYFLDQSTYQWLIKSDSTNSLVFNKFQGGTGEAMRIDSSGNVGIGVVPTEKLHIQGATPYIVLSNTEETESGITFIDSASPSQSAKITYDSGASNALIFYNNAAAERMRITSSGEVQHTTGVVSYNGKKTVTRIVSGHGGANIFPTSFGSSTAQVGHLYVTESGTANYLIAALFKQNSTAGVGVTVIANNNITVSATNSGGTIALTGYTTSANVRMKAVIEEC